VLPWWQDKDITTATNQDCANYRIWLEESGDLKPQSIKHAIALFRRVVRHAKKHIHGFEIKIDDYSVPKVNNEVTEDLTQEQYQRLLSVLQSDKVTVEGKTVKINRAVADIMLLILNTGMRRGEVLKLQWQHVNFDRGTILLKEPKGGKDVLLPMNTGAREVLMRQKKTSMYVFPNPQGGKRSHINVQARKIRDLAGLPKDFRPLHGLRHYYATELASKGVDITVISELLGHKSVGITMRYVNARDEKKRMAVELVSVGGMK
jgi:integrase